MVALRYRLTPREVQVMALICAGMADKQIAASMGCRESTIKTSHKYHLFNKTGMGTSVELLGWARMQGIGGGFGGWDDGEQNANVSTDVSYKMMAYD